MFRRRVQDQSGSATAAIEATRSSMATRLTSGIAGTPIHNNNPTRHNYQQQQNNHQQQHRARTSTVAHHHLGVLLGGSVAPGSDSCCGRRYSTAASGPVFGRPRDQGVPLLPPACRGSALLGGIGARRGFWNPKG